MNIDGKVFSLSMVEEMLVTTEKFKERGREDEDEKESYDKSEESTSRNEESGEEGGVYKENLVSEKENNSKMMETNEAKGRLKIVKVKDTGEVEKKFHHLLLEESRRA